MKKSLITAFILLFIFASCKKNNNPDSKPDPTTPTPEEIATVVNQTLAGKDSLTQFASAFKNLDLTEEEVKNGITVFAPSNNAYTLKGSSLRKRQAETPTGNVLPDSSVVKDYIIAGKLNPDTFTEGALLTALSGKKLTLSKKGDDWYLNDVYVNISSLSADGNSVVFTLAGLLNSSILPKIIGVSDVKTFPGWLLTIYGRNLGDTVEAVKIDGIDAKVHSANADSVVITVPQGVAEGKLTVATQGRTLTAAENLTIQQAQVTTIAGTTGGPVQGIAVDAENNIWWTDNFYTNTINARLVKYSNSGELTNFSPLLNLDTVNVPAFKGTYLWAVAVNKQNQVYVANSRAQQNQGYAGIFRANTGDLAFADWWAGSNPIAVNAPTKGELKVMSTAMIVDADDNLVFGNAGNVQKIWPNGGVSTLVNATEFRAADAEVVVSTTIYGLAMSDGTLYMSDAASGRIWIKNSDGLRVLAGNNTLVAKDGTGAGAQFGAPFGIVLDKKGNLYVCDNDYNTSQFLIRMINPKGVVTTIAGKVSQDNVDGTGTNAGFNGVNSIAIDNNGVLYVGTDVGTIRKITIQ